MRVMQTKDGKRVQITEAGEWHSNTLGSFYDAEVLNDEGEVVVSHLSIRGEAVLEYVIRLNGWVET